MKAAVYRENGGPEVLSYEEVADPVPGADEVLIRVEAISIEGGDLLNRRMVPLPHSPHIVGYSTAGTVIAVGEHVTDLRVGQRVSALTHHLGTMVVREDDTGVHLVWTTEFAPASQHDWATNLMNELAELIKKTLDAAYASQL